MILCNSEVEGWSVRYQQHGVPQRMICLDKVKADAYAVQYHGIVRPMHCPVEPQPSAEPIATAPWNG